MYVHNPKPGRRILLSSQLRSGSVSAQQKSRPEGKPDIVTSDECERTIYIKANICKLTQLKMLIHDIVVLLKKLMYEKILLVFARHPRCKKSTKNLLWNDTLKDVIHSSCSFSPDAYIYIKLHNSVFIAYADC